MSELDNSNGNHQEEIDVTDISYPLMILFKQLAPGTLNHTKQVALLVEQISSELKLDVRKMKIAALYHDIGKILYPKYFTENQTSEDTDPHENLLPEISAKLIMSHVGHTTQILINDQNIPRDVIEWCSQHHGTSLIKYFYNKSKANIDDHFRYFTSKPQCIESALLMICDQLEARFKSLIQAGKLDDVKQFVDDVISELINDEQLDEVILKLGHLRKIKEILSKDLLSQFSKRVDYDEAKSN